MNTEKLEELYSNFIEKSAKLGEVAHSEQSHGAGVSEKESTDEALEYFGDLLNQVNQSFTNFKEEAKNTFAWSVTDRKSNIL